MACTDFESNSKIVEEVLFWVAESGIFLIPSMRTENAKKLARELLHKVQGEQVSVDNGKDNGAPVGGDNSKGTSYIEEFSKFSCALISKIINLSTPDSKVFEIAKKEDMVSIPSQHASSELVVPDLTDDELSALCYAAGYIPFALKKKLKDRYSSSTLA